MSDCDCYKEICKFVKEYAENQAKEGESIEVGLFKEYTGGGCFISLTYDTIVEKKHFGRFNHLDPYFLDRIISRKCVQAVVDDILERYRREKE